MPQCFSIIGKIFDITGWLGVDNFNRHGHKGIVLGMCSKYQ
jgi:hypothetical protein